MLQVVRHEWTSGARFAFNCYLHWPTLVIRECDGAGHLIQIKEGVTQGDPTGMITYGLGILPLIRDLQTSHPGVTKPWYVNDAGTGGTFSGIRGHLDDLMVRFPLWGYFLEPTKSILVVFLRNIPRGKYLFHGYGLEIVTGSRYIWGD